MSAHRSGELLLPSTLQISRNMMQPSCPKALQEHAYHPKSVLNMALNNGSSENWLGLLAKSVLEPQLLDTSNSRSKMQAPHRLGLMNANSRPVIVKKDEN